MTIAQFNSEGDGQGNDQGFKAPSPQDHVAQGVKILETALELAKAGFRVFPVHGLRWVRVVSPVGLATAVPGGDIRLDNENEEDGEAELEVRWRVEIRCTCGVVSCANIGKHPVGNLVPHGSKEASTDLLQVEAWFRLPGSRAGEQDGARALTAAEQGWVPWNLAVATGEGLVVIDAESKQLHADHPTGLVVLDEWETWTRGTSLPVAAGDWRNTISFEPGEDGELVVKTVSTADLAPAPEGGVQRQGFWPGTLRVRTGSGGMHVYLLVNEQMRIKSRNRVLPAIDIKGDGGYVLAPPSRHASGGVYSVEEGRYARTGAPGTIGKASDDLVNWLLTVKGNTYSVRRLADTTGSMPDDYDFMRIFANGCPAGFRDYFVNDLCFRLRRKGLSYEDASATLRQQWTRMEQPADSYYDWGTCIYKIKRVWAEVSAEDQSELPAWRPPAEGEMQAVRGPAVAADASAGAENAQDATALTVNGVPEIAPITWRSIERLDLTMLLTDTGNSMRFAQRMRDQVRYSPEQDQWFVWDGSRWAPDVLNIAMRLTKEIIQDLYAEALDPVLSETQQRNLQQWADQSQAVSRRQAMLSLAKAEPGIAVRTSELDSDPLQLVVKNGTLNLETGTIRESAAEDLNTMMANVVYDPEATCPGWRKHVEFVTGGDQDLALYLQRAIGYTLTGKTKEQKLFFLHGNGDNGKNVFMDVIAALMGDYSLAADENFLSHGSEHPTQLAGLQGKRLIYADETDEGRKVRESRIKHLTGSQTVRARFMRQDYFQFTPRFKIWIMGNHKPSISGNDDGIWRRIELVPFVQKITEGDKVKDFHEILIRDELSGILNWALEGLKMWNTIGLSESKIVKKATAVYREDEDEEKEFFADRVVLCSEEEGGVVVFKELYSEYVMWCMLGHTAKEDIKGKKSFAQDLERRGFVRPDNPRRVAGYDTVQRVWIGLRMRTPEDAHRS